MSTPVQVIVPPEELKLIHTAQEREVAWWKDHPTMESLSDVERQLILNRAVRVTHARRALHAYTNAPLYKVSGKVPEYFRVLSNPAFDMLEFIARRWQTIMQTQGIEHYDLFLVITSLGRTTQYQKELISQGYPAVESNGTHTKLGAFDIGVYWFRENNRLNALYALDTVLADLHLRGRINWIYEQSIGVYHVAVNPKP